MARKDVELVIRAKDEAAKAVDSVSKAIETLIASQNKLSGSADKSQNALSELGGAFSGLQKALGGQSVTDKIAKELTRAGAAAERLQSQITETEAASKKLTTTLRQTTEQTEQLRAKAAQAEKVLRAEAAALKQIEITQKASLSGLRKANTEKTRLAAADERITRQITEQEQRLVDVGRRYEDLGNQIRETVNPSAQLARQFQNSEVALQKQNARLLELKNRQTETRVSIESTERSIRELSTALDQSNSSYQRQNAVVEKSKVDYRELSAAAESSATQQRKLAAEGQRLSGSLTSQNRALELAKNELKELDVSADRAGQALKDLGAEAGGVLQTELVKQRRLMLEARREQASYEQQIRKTQAAMSGFFGASKQQVDQFKRLTEAAKRTKQEYAEQQARLAQLQATVRNSGSSVGGLQGAQQGVQAIRGEAVAAAAKYARDLQRITQETKEAAAASRNAAAQTNIWAAAYKRLYGETRQALSFNQRLRGEVLSLISAYAGFFGVIQLLRGTVTAFQTLEAAASRLNVVFDGDQERVASELDFIRRSAQRLGIQFGTLSEQYANFAVNTKGTILAGQETRNIFIALAEAARVLKLPVDGVQRAFTALGQIASKGVVSMEEVRQQLGDQLPGALRTFAEAAGFGTDSLDDFYKLVAEGKVSSDVLAEVADVLTDQYGSQLPKALDTTAAKIGAFQNAVFFAQERLGEGGFIEAFDDLLVGLTQTLESGKFESALDRLSGLFAVLADTIALAAENFEVLVIAATTFLTIKIVGVIGGIVAGLVAQTRATIQAAIQMRALSVANAQAAASSRGLAAGAAAATTGVRGLSLAVKGLLASSGFGLLITIAGVAFGSLITKTDELAESTNSLERNVDKLKNKYDEAARSGEKFVGSLAGITVSQAQRDLDQLADALDEARSELSRNVLPGGADPNSPRNRGLAELAKQLKEGAVSAADFRAQIDSLIGPTDNEAVLDFAAGLADRSEGLEKLELAAAKAQAVLRSAKGEATAADEALLGLSESADDAADKLSVAAELALKKYEDALRKIKDLIPELEDELKLDDLQVDLNNYTEVLREQDKLTPENQQLIDRAQEAIDQKAFDKYVKAIEGAKDGLDASARLLREFEGFRADAYADITFRDGKPVNSGFRAGFGSDTITLADGTIKKITEGSRVNAEDASRDLARRIREEFQARVISQVGQERFNTFTPEQQGVLNSIAYNYGDLPDRILGAVREGTTKEISTAIRSLRDDNPRENGVGVNRERRDAEAFIFSRPVDTEEAAQRQQKADETAAEAAKKITEERVAGVQAIQESIEATAFENALLGQTTTQIEIARALREAELTAQKAGIALTQQQIDAIKEGVRLRLQEKQVEEDRERSLELVKDKEEELNDILARRAELEKQIAVSLERGDVEGALGLAGEAQALNAELEAIIDTAIRMYEAIGGKGADLAILKLQTMKQESVGFKAIAENLIIDFEQFNELLSSGLSNAADEFSKKVAEGVPVFQAAREAFLQFASDFLRQIAQMIIQKTIFNALNGATAGKSGGPLGFLGGIFGAGHTGGIVGSKRIGSGNQSRSVPLSVFAGASKFHEGGFPGLRPQEVPAILLEGEEVLSKSDPRNALNSGGQASKAPSPQNIKIVNAIDSGAFVESGLNTSVGEKAILNFMRNNADAVKASLG